MKLALPLLLLYFNFESNRDSGVDHILYDGSQLLCEQLEREEKIEVVLFKIRHLYNVLFREVVVVVGLEVLQEFVHLGLAQWHRATSLLMGLGFRLSINSFQIQVEVKYWC